MVQAFENEWLESDSGGLSQGNEDWMSVARTVSSDDEDSEDKKGVAAMAEDQSGAKIGVMVGATEPVLSKDSDKFDANENGRGAVGSLGADELVDKVVVVAVVVKSVPIDDSLELAIEEARWSHPVVEKEPKCELVESVLDNVSGVGRTFKHTGVETRSEAGATLQGEEPEIFVEPYPLSPTELVEEDGDGLEARDDAGVSKTRDAASSSPMGASTCDDVQAVPNIAAGDDAEMPVSDDDAPLVDIERLLVLLENTKAAGTVIEGKDVLLLVGATGAGKTTAMLRMAGVEFEEMEVDGTDHFAPVNLDRSLAKFEVKCGTKSVTKHLQAVGIVIGGKKVVVCDTPGFGDSDGMETDIANGIALIRALHRAKSVKPVLVLNAEGIMSDRFRSLSRVLETISRMMADEDGVVDFSSFSFLFTHCSEKESQRMHKKLAGFMRDLGEKRPLLSSLLTVMMEKTSPTAQTIDPLDECCDDFLGTLWGNEGDRINAPTVAFRPFVSKAASIQIKSHLLVLLANLELSLGEVDFETAHNCMKQLELLDTVLLGVDNALCQASMVLDKIMTRLMQCSERKLLHVFKTTWEDKTIFKSVALDMERDIAAVYKLSGLCEVYSIETSRTFQDLFASTSAFFDSVVTAEVDRLCASHSSLSLAVTWLLVRACTASDLIIHDHPSCRVCCPAGLLYQQALERFGVVISDVEMALLDMSASFPENRDNYGRIYALWQRLASIGRAVSDICPALLRMADAATDNARALAAYRVALASRDPGASTSAKQLMERLILLKRASRDVICWRDIVNGEINKMLSESIRIGGTGFLLDLSVELRHVDGEDAPLAQQLLEDHGCFGGVVNAIFNERTKAQGVDYVVGGLGLLYMESHRLKELYGRFQREYTMLVIEGIRVLASEEGSSVEGALRPLAGRAIAVAANYTLGYSDQVTSLTAYVFAMWSLMNYNSFVTTGSNSDGLSEYLVKPHAAQVLAIWLMLNCSGSDGQVLESRLIEVKTGEGKSIVLGVTATILALLGCEVDCFSYSAYLSNRDYNEFIFLFNVFGVENAVWYGDAAALCDKVLADQRSSAEDLISNSHAKRATCSVLGSIRVMLVDEVDVFFELFGKKLLGCASIAKKTFTDFALFVWDNCRTIEADSLIISELGQAVIAEFPVDSRALIESHLRAVCRDALVVRKGEEHPYCLSCGRIAYKRFDGLTANTSYGYETAFVYIKEWERKNLTWPQMESGVFLKPTTGFVSYAELPLEYCAVLGTTGTLKGLGAEEKHVLKSVYAIEKYAYLPSVYGANRLNFDSGSQKDVILCQDTTQHFACIVGEIEKRQGGCGSGRSDVKRAVLVFFDAKSTLLDFYNSDEMAPLKSRAQVITEQTPVSDKDGMFLKATEQGAITLMIREFGRGTDFKCYDKKMLDCGGVHVIQAFFSNELSEEVQIKGRCARQGADGSYSMVLAATQIQRDMELTLESLTAANDSSQLYTFLTKKREALSESTTSQWKQSMKEQEASHYRTLAFNDAMKEGPRRRQECLSFLHELNGLGSSDAFCGNNLKQVKLSQYKNLRHQHALADKKRREEARKRKNRTGQPTGIVAKTSSPFSKGLWNMLSNGEKGEVLGHYV